MAFTYHPKLTYLFPISAYLFDYHQDSDYTIACLSCRQVVQITFVRYVYLIDLCVTIYVIRLTYLIIPQIT